MTGTGHFDPNKEDGNNSILCIYFAFIESWFQTNFDCSSVALIQVFLHISKHKKNLNNIEVWFKVAYCPSHMFAFWAPKSVSTPGTVLI